MHKAFTPRWRRSTFGLLGLVAALAAAISVSLTGSVLAQTTPTPTPEDPLWRAFVIVRDAVEEEFSVDLTYVRSYTYEETEWPNGIDTCDSDILEIDQRQVYFGWTFIITSLRGEMYEARISFNLRIVTVCDEVTTAAAPTPDATVDPNLPAPVVNTGVTGGFEIGGHVDGFSNAAITAMRQSGMTWVKKQLRFYLGDSTGQAQSFINQAHANGFRIVIGIVGDRTQMGNFQAYIASYSTFVAQVAALGADAIEVWNEPNIDREWPNGQINGANYTQLLASAYNAIKRSNPNTIVISGAPAPTGFFGAAGCTAQGCNDDVFMQQMAQAGAANYMDCIGLHYNEGIVSPSTTSGDPRGNYPTYYFGSMLQRGLTPFPGRPVCFTELGYLTPVGFNAPLPPAFAWASNVTLEQHASWLADAVSRAAASGRVRLVIIWNVNFTLYSSDPMAGYAIIRPDGSCPACSRLGAVMRG